MFEVGDVLVYTDGKIYEIVDLVERDFGVGIQQYYQLKQNSMYKDEKNTMVFTPVSRAERDCRSLMSRNEVIELIDSYHSIEPIWISDSKQRKVVFSEYAHSKDPKQILKLFKSLLKRHEELRDTNKSLTFTDKKLMEKVKTDFIVEFSLVLNLSFDEVVEYVTNRLSRK